jgi:hypothetical protein
MYASVPSASLSYTLTSQPPTNMIHGVNIRVLHAQLTSSLFRLF